VVSTLGCKNAIGKYYIHKDISMDIFKCRSKHQYNEQGHVHPTQDKCVPGIQSNSARNERDPKASHHVHTPLGKLANLLCKKKLWLLL
jgi:hypothetical protein